MGQGKDGEMTIRYCPSGADCSCMGSSPWRLLSSCGLCFLQAGFLCMGSPQVAACCDVVSSVGWNVDICSHVVLSMGFSGTTCFTMVSPLAAGALQLWHLENLLPFLHWPWCLHSYFSYSSVSHLAWSIFYPFLNTLSQGHPPVLLMGSALDSGKDSWNWLCLMRRWLLVSSLRSHSYRSPQS